MSRSRVPLDFGRWILEISLDQVIAIARLALVLLAFGALYLDGFFPYTTEVHFILFGYLLFSLTALIIEFAGRVSPPWQHWAYAVDLGAVAALMVLTDGPTSPFFVFFTFLLLSATLRWHWRGAIATMVTLVAFLFVLAFLHQAPLTGSDAQLDRIILRSGYLLVIGVMLGYVGAYRERSRGRFAKLATWPVSGLCNGKLQLHLPHAADVLGARRMLCIWDVAHEPGRHFLLWEGGEIQHIREAATVPMRALVDTEPGDAIFIAANGQCRSARLASGLGRCAPVGIDSSLRAKYRIGPAAFAPFSNAGCAGYLFALDCHRCDDLLPLAAILAKQIGVEIEHDWLRRKIQSAAVKRERSRMARNIHDGVLQALTAASLNLKMCAQGAEQKTRAELDRTRGLLADEQKRVRHLIERAWPKLPTQNFHFASEGKLLLDELGACWGCETRLQVNPGDAEVSPDLAEHLYLILAEAVGNATRHGHASRVAIELHRAVETLDLQIDDNGSGFPGLSGTYGDGVLGALNAGPRSLCERVKDIGGHLTLTTSTAGAQLRIKLPL